ncbi:MAG: hypothetical protein KC996_03545 [Phycisphaerales bacterium]|nr:hypothetical protein [Phycisphaerales bacterium]
MPIFEIAGQDRATSNARTVQISARDELDAARAAMAQGITEIKLRPMSEREILMMDEKCFLNSGAPALRAASRIKAQDAGEVARSILLDHPFIVITGSVFCALMLDRLVGLLVTL